MINLAEIIGLQVKATFNIANEYNCESAPRDDNNSDNPPKRENANNELPQETAPTEEIATADSDINDSSQRLAALHLDRRTEPTVPEISVDEGSSNRRDDGGEVGSTTGAQCDSTTNLASDGEHSPPGGGGGCLNADLDGSKVIDSGGRVNESRGDAWRFTELREALLAPAQARCPCSTAPADTTTTDLDEAWLRPRSEPRARRRAATDSSARILNAGSGRPRPSLLLYAGERDDDGCGISSNGLSKGYEDDDDEAEGEPDEDGVSGNEPERNDRNRSTQV